MNKNFTLRLDLFFIFIVNVKLKTLKYTKTIATLFLELF